MASLLKDTALAMAETFCPSAFIRLVCGGRLDEISCQHPLAVR